MTEKYLTISLCGLFAAIAAIFIFSPSKKSKPAQQPTIAELEFTRGANRALETFALLNRQLQARGEAREMGQMALIVCNRLGVPPSDFWTPRAPVEQKAAPSVKQPQPAPQPTNGPGEFMGQVIEDGTNKWVWANRWVVAQ